MNKKLELKKKIHAVDFAIHELVLFLDTHPCDAQALQSFTEYRDKLMTLSEQYVNLFGPLEVSDVSGHNGWTWGMTPMPFEGGR